MYITGGCLGKKQGGLPVHCGDTRTLSLVVAFVPALVHALRLRLRFFRFLERELVGPRLLTPQKDFVPSSYAFRKFQRTFHDGRTAAGDGMSAGQRGVECSRESCGMAGARISACP